MYFITKLKFLVLKFQFKFLTIASGGKQYYTSFGYQTNLNFMEIALELW